MCEECGCSEVEEKSVVVDRSVNEKNDVLAEEILNNLKDKGVFCVNVMGSPGSGKTTFIEKVAGLIGVKDIAVVQGDLESDIDKKRLEAVGVDTYQINTHSGCHLNAAMINKALMDLNLKGKKYLFIENVGNLVCPAGVKLGQHMNLVVSSVTEGSDKPKKYPHIFMDASLVVISKCDLVNVVDFDEDEYMKDVMGINGKAKVVQVSSKDDEGFKEVVHVIEHKREHMVGIEHKH